MRVSVFVTAAIMSLHALPKTLSAPISRRSALSRRSDSSTCEFYGYADAGGIYNDYTIDVTNWRGICPAEMPAYIEEQCMTAVDDFSCAQQYENLYDIEIKFRLNKAVLTQPDCVTRALELVTQTYSYKQSIECICLAECWASETGSETINRERDMRARSM